MTIFESPCPGAFAIYLGVIKIEKVGRLAIVCLRFMHILEVGHRVRIGWGRAEA